MRALFTAHILPLPLLLSLLGMLQSPLPCLADLQWPYNLSPSTKYYPEDEPLVRRSIEIQELFANQTPHALRKMSSDKGQMFLLEYWGFNRDERRIKQSLAAGHTVDQKGERIGTLENITQIRLPQPHLLLHTDRLPAISNRFSRSPLEKRDFRCPTGTTSCTSINRPNSCCANGLQCNIITDTGFGDVGCCADSSCSGEVTGCQEGYTSCPANQGGGCCIPGYACSGVGCTYNSLTIFHTNISNQVTRCPCIDNCSCDTTHGNSNKYLFLDNYDDL